MSVNPITAGERAGGSVRPANGIAPLLLALCLAGCAAPQLGLTEADVAWIEKGRTTRQEVLSRLGPPRLSVQLEEGQGAGEYVEYGGARPAASEGGGVPPAIEPRPRGGLPQVFQPPIETLRPRAPEPRLWITYDPAGVVRDFGLAEPPGDPTQK